jgi:hypothetical protein
MASRWLRTVDRKPLPVVPSGQLKKSHPCDKDEPCDGSRCNDRNILVMSARKRGGSDEQMGTPTLYKTA